METSPYKSDPRYPPNSKNGGNLGRNKNDKIGNFQYFSIKSYVVDAYKNRLGEAILINIQNI